MIPEPDQILTIAESSRWYLTKLARALVVEHGVSPELVMRDCREGVEHAKASLDRGRSS